MTRHLLASFLILVTLTCAAASQVVGAPARVRVSESILQGLMIRKVAPDYPPLAKQAKIQGIVVLKVRISKSGDVGNIQLVSGHSMLAPAAIEAVKRWKYMPYLLNAEPVEVETNVTVNFTLSDNPPTEGVVGSVPGGIPDGEQGSIVRSQDGTPRPAVPQRVRVSSGVAQGLLVKKVPPQYPQDAKDQHIQGVVLMQVTVDKEGSVAKVQLISGHPLLAPPAIEAVKQWKYRPYLLNNIPVEVETQIQVNFTLAQ